MNEILDKITTIIEDYNSSDGHHPEGLLNMARTLAANLFFLEKHRANIQKKFEGQKYLLINNDGMPVSKAENVCNFRYPEMYMLRRVMEAGYKNLDIMRSEVSWLRAEMNNTNING